MWFFLKNARPIDAVIFDMDGLLIDTERLAVRALGAAANSMGTDVPEAFCRVLIGVPADQCRKMARGRCGPDFSVQAYFESADRYMTELIEAGQLRPKPGASELLTWLEEQRVPKAVATSSTRAKALDRLWNAGILSRFDTIVSRDDVQRGRPYPDLYLRAAETLGIPPAGCLALEDSYNGVRAAHAAGAQAIMVPDLLVPTDEMQSMCETIATDLHTVQSWLMHVNEAASVPAKAA
jgi:HAD superfamily hydrolase (TIGR01509 family)